MITQRTVALIGNPNSGKTTLFNQLTGAHQRVGNWPGVTVERKEDYFYTASHRIILVDLPGVYSITTLSLQSSLDEQIACSYIFDGQPDVLINVVDAAYLERNLFLTLQLRELGVPCIVALKMLDIAYRQNITIDIPKLEQQLGCQVVSLISNCNDGITKLKTLLENPIITAPILAIEYPEAICQAIHKIESLLPAASSLPHPPRWLALHILEGDIYSSALIKAPKLIDSLHVTLQQEAPLLIADARYGVVITICEQVSNGHLITTNNRVTTSLDAILLNRWLGIPLFFLVIYLMFILTIKLGGSLQPLFEAVSKIIVIESTQLLSYQLHAPRWLTLLLIQGIGGGINTLLPLIPQISLMYFCLSFLENSGYMARTAFVIDKLMQYLGLPGKSFVPLIIGFGCNIPAVMGARTLNVHRDRLMTIMMAPFMSCGARLTIFTIFASIFFSNNGATLVFSLYMLGIIVAIFTGLMLKYVFMYDERIPFIMELPVYHMPHMKHLLLQTWQLLKNFMRRTSKVIVLASVIISPLDSFTLHGHLADNVHNSILASISKKITPLLKPIGVQEENWQATIALMSGAIAKEMVVSTLNTLYTFEQMTLVHTPFEFNKFNFLATLSNGLADTWQNIQDTFCINSLYHQIEVKTSKNDQKIMMNYNSMSMMSRKFGSATAAYSYLIFVLLYVPCVSVLGVIAHESNISWMILAALWGCNIAYSLATLFYQIATFSYHYFYSMIAIMLVLSMNCLLIIVLYNLRHHFNKS
ncbi:Fe(2+) transporter permease subunit FeoB [Candidatus Palibaumannia cicadellinicola]|uniref:Ferrous iron transport protein B n=1 Tax=Candidatus Palibaumannia cicadellinicola TaxID=186490 RepID=A0A088MXJ0_9GAMM|nr:Fe(2+) transporter permease subunit FeoB [Candidatus Baumannia cicadellinicola]AIN46899.1 Ferrous iron transport protein B [Candidatus Baumannia cicadellinicola]